MSSLQELLSQDGFQSSHPRKPRKPRKPPKHPPPPASATLSAGRHQSLDLQPRRTRSLSLSSTPLAATTTTTDDDDDDTTAIDKAAIHTIISILSSYAGRFLKDSASRRRLRDKCSACLTASRGAAHAVLANLELGIESIERLIDESPTSAPRESKIKSLQNSIRLLSVVASLNSPLSRAGYTCGIPNSHLSACAQLYLSIVYKLERNNQASALHLLQMFCDAPYFARRNLLPHLWDHFFLPHLLHLKVWYSREVELVAGWDVEDRDQRLKSLNRTYNDQMDAGTAQFALYYREWLKAGNKPPPIIPSVSLPWRPSCIEPLAKQSLLMSPSSTNGSMYQAVFSPSLQQGDNRDKVLIDDAKIVMEGEVGAREGSCKFGQSVHVSHSGSSLRQHDVGVHQRQRNSVQECPDSEVIAMPRRSYSFRIFACRSDPNRGAICHTQISKNASTANSRDSNSNVPSTNLGQAISLISNSDCLSECESAIRVVAKAWLDSHGDSSVKTALSTSSVVEGLLEVALTSKDDEVLELAISILAQLVAKNETNRQIVLNADPQLEIFLRLLRSKTLFLKAAVLMYLLKPKAKQMLSLDWIPLVLRVLKYGDQIQTLFTIQCRAKSAAFYFLDQLLMGFDVDGNVENAKQMVAMGGLDLLIRRLETGDVHEKKTCVSLLTTCIRADGSCRHYVAANVRKESIIQMLLGSQLKYNGIALSLLCELVCLNRTSQIIKFLNGLKNVGCLNAMHVLLVYLQKTQLEERPLAAAVLLQLDLLGDPLQYSICREEGIDAIVAALEHNSHNKKLQEQCSRALLLMGIRFSCIGETTAETWLLKKAGLDDGSADLFNSKEIIADEFVRPEEEEKVTEDWLRSSAIILLRSGNKRLLVALSNCIADGIPCLARSCLVTVAWMSNSISSLHNASTLSSLACSILAPRLLVSLNYDRALEERVLASFSLLNFARHPDCLPKLFPFDKETICSLQDLAQVTWTAKELLFSCCR